MPVKLETNAAGDANAGGAVNVPEKLAEKGGAVKPPPPPLPLPLPGLLAAAKAAANGDVENEPVNAAAENAGLALAALSLDVAVADPNIAKDGAAGAVGCEEPPTLAFGASLDARASFTGAATGLAASVGELAAFLVGATAAVASPSLSSATATSSARFLDAATSSVALCTGKASPQEKTFTQSRSRMQRGQVQQLSRVAWGSAPCGPGLGPFTWCDLARRDPTASWKRPSPWVSGQGKNCADLWLSVTMW